MDSQSIKAIRLKHTKKLLKNWELAHSIEEPLKAYQNFCNTTCLSKKQKGAFGELLVEHLFTKSKLYSVLKRNYRTPYGELDLVLRANHIKDILVCLEVKTLFLENKLNSEIWSYQQRRRFVRSCFHLQKQTGCKPYKSLGLVYKDHIKLVNLEESLFIL